MKALFKWQKIILCIIGILTFTAVTLNTMGKEFNIGYFFDLILAVGLNIFLLFMILKFGNWIYLKKRKKE